MTRIVAQLGGDDAAEQQRWQARSAELVDAIVAGAIEASALDFPTDHTFWGPFTRSQARDIDGRPGVARLPVRRARRLGRRRVPTQRDLSLALGYAGLDPMRIRHWPTEAEMADPVCRRSTVAADEYLARPPAA